MKPGLGLSLLEAFRLLRRERAEYLANLTATQGRCTELLEEARTARRERDEIKALAEKACECLGIAANECAELRTEIAILRATLSSGHVA